MFEMKLYLQVKAKVQYKRESLEEGVSVLPGLGVESSCLTPRTGASSISGRTAVASIS
jgi:hypothetical protein